MVMQTFSWGAAPDEVIALAIAENASGIFTAELNATDFALLRETSPRAHAAALIEPVVDGKWFVALAPANLVQFLSDLRSSALIRLQREGIFGPEAALRSDILSTLGIEEI